MDILIKSRSPEVYIHNRSVIEAQSQMHALMKEGRARALPH